MKCDRKTRLAKLWPMFVILVIATPLAAGDEEFGSSKVGISAALQGSQLDFLFPIWTDSRVVLTPSFGVTAVSGSVTDWRFGLLARYNIRTGKAVPYCGLRFSYLRLKPVSADAVTDALVGAAIGGEYFIERHFSLGVEAQLNAAFSGDESLRFGNPGGTNVNTATSAMVSFYF